MNISDLKNHDTAVAFVTRCMEIQRILLTPQVEVIRPVGSVTKNDIAIAACLLAAAEAYIAHICTAYSRTDRLAAFQQIVAGQIDRRDLLVGAQLIERFVHAEEVIAVLDAYDIEARGDTVFAQADVSRPHLFWGLIAVLCDMYAEYLSNAKIHPRTIALNLSHLPR